MFTMLSTTFGVVGPEPSPPWILYPLDDSGDVWGVPYPGAGLTVGHDDPCGSTHLTFWFHLH